MSLINYVTNRLVPEGISKLEDPLGIAIDALIFTNIRLSPKLNLDPTIQYKLKISIGGTVAESNHFTLVN